MNPIKKYKFKYFRQLNGMDCGPSCLRMVANYYGKYYSGARVRELTGFSKAGVTLLGISDAAEELGFETTGTSLTFSELEESALLPCIIHWDKKHFVVVVSIKKKFATIKFWKKREKFIKVADPGSGIFEYNKAEFLKLWQIAKHNNEDRGYTLLLQPTTKFYTLSGDKKDSLNWSKIFRYLNQEYRKILQIILAFLLISTLQLVFPFLTQSIVDNGINSADLNFVTVVLIAQLALIVSRSSVEFMRSFLLQFLSSVINVSVLNEFWNKLTRLPLSYFELHNTGDTLQRLNDNKKIQTFVTGSLINTVFSIFNFFIFGIALLFYHSMFFLILICSSLIYYLWIKYFLIRRKKINHETFRLSSQESGISLQLIQGMQDLKLNKGDKIHTKKWLNIQSSIFKIGFKGLTYTQIENIGGILISQGKDAIITFLVAGFVINGELTFGAMLAVQYIIGQLSNPIEQFILFMQSAVDANVSMERVNDIHFLDDEEDPKKVYLDHLPKFESLYIKNVSFSYPGSLNKKVLDNINLEIPKGKITAIVGISGSGKSTLIKLLLQIYRPNKGEILIGDKSLYEIRPSYWRNECGAVLQEGFIFADSIAQNIALGEEEINYARLEECCDIANIIDFIHSLPGKFDTQLGHKGVGLSQGQKQRILIARSLYKNPQFLFLDEATNSLDTWNEKAIVDKMNKFFKGKTVVIVAHRLSTVKRADKLVVLERGGIVEEGTHLNLANMRGKYFDLVKNQLELDG